jgi:rhodanese-related sulfurtransferase
MIDQIYPQGLKTWITQHASEGQALVLDVREPWEIETASIRADGFELVCIPMNTIPDRLNELPQDRPIACLCHHGMRSMRVASFLVQQGFACVANIAGGIDAWSQQVDTQVPHY